MIHDRIGSLLRLCARDETRFPPTDLYNEGWMLRVCLDWLHHNRDKHLSLSLPYPNDANWYSEALLPSAFLARYRGDKLAESWTHADGVVGQFTIGAQSKGGFELDTDASCFAVIEAKMSSKLSSGVSNASFYNQAARNVACMAEVMRLAGVAPGQLPKFGFFVTAPASRIEEGVFEEFMSRDSICGIVAQRVDQYGGAKRDWHEVHFLPAMDRITISTVSWEQIVGEITELDSEFGNELSDFYRACLKFNRPAG